VPGRQDSQSTAWRGSWTLVQGNGLAMWDQAQASMQQPSLSSMVSHQLHCQKDTMMSSTTLPLLLAAINYGDAKMLPPEPPLHGHPQG
jgi:hypothetical protein